MYLEQMVTVLAKACSLDPRSDFFLPHRDAGDVGVSGSTDEIFEADLKALKDAKIVVALLDGQDVDSGTAVELGIAFVAKKPIYGLLTDRRARDPQGRVKINNMIWGVCREGRRIYASVETLASALAKEI